MVISHPLWLGVCLFSIYTSLTDVAESWRSPESTRGSSSKKPREDVTLWPRVTKGVRKDRTASFLCGVGDGMMSG